MHLVRKDERVQTRSCQIGGFAGWMMEWAHALWLGATMRREVKKQMQVIETLCIGGRKQLVLVRCGRAQFLVGTSADTVQTIVQVQCEADGDLSPVRGFGERP